MGSLCDSQQVIPIHAFVFPDLIVLAHAAGVHHDSPLLVGFWVEQIIAL